MTQPIEGELVVDAATELLKKMDAYKGEIDNLIVAFTTKSKPDSIMFGSTPKSTALWVLGALDYCRWHTYAGMSSHRVSQAQAIADAIMEAALREESGLKADA